jgi:hypothetical protein
VRRQDWQLILEGHAVPDRVQAVFSFFRLRAVAFRLAATGFRSEQVGTATALVVQFLAYGDSVVASDRSPLALAARRECWGTDPRIITSVADI